MHLDIGRRNRLSLRDSKTGRRIIALQYEVGVKVLRTRQNLSFTSQVSYGTFKGSSSGSISENPVARAIGSRAVSDLARCSAIVSVEEINSKGKEKGGVTDEKGFPSH